MPADLRQALESASRALAGLAGEDGDFLEYDLPVGPSDQWVTALAGLALAEAASVLGDSPGHIALDAAGRAARWLMEHRYPRGWGYNARTGPDADSTAHALLLFHSLGLPAPAECLDWLEARWQPEGGFATYAPDAPGFPGRAWALGHPCVTPVAFLAVWVDGRSGLAVAFAGYMERTRLPDGSWPSYWWRSNRYAEFQALRTLRVTGPERLIDLPEPDAARTYDFSSVHELALITGIEALRRSGAAPALAAELLRHRLPSGGWPGSPELRVTDPDCPDPWNYPRGALYADAKGLACSASAIRALCLTLNSAI